MPKNIPTQLINEVIDRCDIVELISSYIPLKKAGRNFKANCPFHNEKTPSFLVSPDKQIFHCFGCGQGGNALSFIMKHERLEFREAIQILADRAGITLHLEDSGNEGAQSFVSELYRILELACDFYQKHLGQNQAAHTQTYFASRCLKPDTVQKFKLGLAPAQWDSLLSYLRSKAISIKVMETAGLIISKTEGGFYDRFRSRLMIPIFDVRNRICAFGARTLGDNTPKYINSPETPIYIKGKNLFGLNFAKDAIREKDCAVIVEGYFDVISPMQQGMYNIVASSGTALTVDQIRLLKRYTHNIVVVFDSDAAGQLAAIRSLELFLAEDLHVKVVDLPPGFDPDLYVRKKGVESFQDLVDTAYDIFDYKLMTLLRIYDIKQVSQKTTAAIEMLSMIKCIKNEILKSEYIKLLAERLSLDENSLRRELDKLRNPQTGALEGYMRTDKAHIEQKCQHPKAERMLCRLILDDASVVDTIKHNVYPSDLQDTRLQKFLDMVFSLADSLDNLKPHHLVNYIEEENCQQLISELAGEETLAYQQEKRDFILRDCIKRIQHNRMVIKCQELHSQINAAQARGLADDVRRLQNEFNELMQLKKKGIAQ